MKKLKNGFEIPVFGFGTWQMGGKNERDVLNDDKADIHAIQQGIRHGITLIDTAEVYANGHSEELVKAAINPFNRSKLFIVSKIMPQNLHYEDVIKHFKLSIERLGVDYLDLYLIHRPNPQIPLKETLRAFDDLVKMGLLRNIGVSNFNKENLQLAQSLTRNPIVVNQVHYNLLFREVEQTGLLEYCQKNDIILMAWRPVEKGAILKIESPIFNMLCTKYHKSKAQIAINWLISQKNVVTLAKSRDLKHLKENLEALTFKMDEQDTELIREKFPDHKFTSNSYLNDPANNYSLN